MTTAARRARDERESQGCNPYVDDAARLSRIAQIIRKAQQRAADTTTRKAAA